MCNISQSHKERQSIDPSSFAALKFMDVLQRLAGGFSCHSTALDRKSPKLGCLRSKSSEAPGSGHMKVP